MSESYFVVKNIKTGKLKTVSAHTSAPQIYTSKRKAEDANEMRYAWLKESFQIVEVELKEIS